MEQPSDSCPIGRDEVLATFVREAFSDPVVVLDGSGRVIDANRAARTGTPPFVSLFGREGRSEEVTAFVRELRARRRVEGRIVRTGEHGAKALVLQGAAVCSSFVVFGREAALEDAPGAEVQRVHGLASVGLVAAVVAHDLNNVLTPIHAVGSLLANRLRDDALGPLAGELAAAAERASRLLRTVLDLSRPRSKQVEIADVNRVIAAMAPLFERLIGPNSELVLDLDETAGHVAIDRARFEHALLNVVINARDAMPSGGRLTITTASVTRSGAGDGGAAWRPYVRIAVRDTGTGMSEEVRTRIFEPFFSTKTDRGGLGLGLSSVRSFAEDSGGAVIASSEPGRGTTLILDLPRAPAPPAALS